MSDSYMKLLYQYVDHAPPSWQPGGLVWVQNGPGPRDGGSDHATVTGLAGSVKSVTHVPAW